MLGPALVFTAIAVAVGYAILERQVQETRDEAANLVGDLSEVTARQVANWRAERKAEAHYFMRAPFFGAAVQSLAADPRDDRLRKDVIFSMDLVIRGHDYESMCLFGEDMKLLASTGPVAAPLSDRLRGLIEQAAETREVVAGSESTHASDPARIVDFVVPFFPKGNLEAPPIAFGVLRIDQKKALAPVLASTKSSRRTLESILLVREGSELRYLSETRHPVEKPMAFSSPGAGDSPGALSGTEIHANTSDYRGEPVVAAVRQIPDTPWILVTKIDQEEVFASLRGRLALIATLIAFFLLAQFFAAWLIWSAKQSSELSQKLTEERQRSEEFERLALLLSSANDAVLVTMPDGRIVEANEAASRFYGYERQELQSMSLGELGGRGAFGEGRPGIREEVHLTKDAAELAVEVSSRSAEWEGRTYGIHVVRDIRLRKEAEEQLQNSLAQLRQALAEIQTSEGRLRSFVEASNLIVWRADAAGNIFELSKEYADYTGVPPEKAYGRQWLALVHAEDRSGMEAAWERSIRSGEQFEFVMRRRAASGEYRYIEARAVPVFDADGLIKEWIGASRDVHDQKLAEQFLLQTQKMEALGTIAGGIAHDFNNILRAIAGNVRLACEALPEGDPARAPLVQVERSCYRAFNLVQQVLTFSRQAEARVRPIKLQEIVEEAATLLRPSIPNSIELSVSIDQGLPCVTADPSQAHQALLNLIGNALQAMESDESGRLEIRLCLAGGHEQDSPRFVCLSVSDTGDGIDPAIQKRIFEPFFTTKPQGKGTGLGLSVVHGVISAHGGRVELESVLEKGSTFRLYFPVTDMPARETAAKRPAALPSSQCTILYIDDDESLVTLATKTLPRKGFHVDGFLSPGDALIALTNEPEKFDAVVTDISMPEMSGFEFASKALKVRPDLPIVMLSGFIRAEDEEHAASLGIRKVLLKTLSDDELVDELRLISAAKTAA